MTVYVLQEMGRNVRSAEEVGGGKGWLTGEKKKG